MDSNATNITNVTLISLGRKKVSPVPSAITFTFGVIGNLLALAVLIRHSRQHKWKIFYRLVGALAVTDLFGILTTSPIAFMVYANNLKWVGGQTTCDYLAFMMIFASMATMFIVGAMSLDRFLAVWYPFFYNATQKKRRIHVALVSLWVVAIFMAMFPLIGFGHVAKHFPYTWCFFDYLGTHIVDQVYSYFYATLGFIIIAMSTVFNGSVIFTLATKHGNTNARRGSIGSNKLRTRRNEIFIMILLVVILLCFAICWTPLMVRIYINSSNNYPVNFAADILAIRFASWNQLLDPWIYVLLRREMLIRYYNFIAKRRAGVTMIRDTSFSSNGSGREKTNMSMENLQKMRLRKMDSVDSKASCETTISSDTTLIRQNTIVQ